MSQHWGVSTAGAEQVCFFLPSDLGEYIVVKCLLVVAMNIQRISWINFALYLFRREGYLQKQAGSWWVGVN